MYLTHSLSPVQLSHPGDYSRYTLLLDLGQAVQTPKLVLRLFRLKPPQKKQQPEMEWAAHVEAGRKLSRRKPFFRLNIPGEPTPRVNNRENQSLGLRAVKFNGTQTPPRGKNLSFRYAGGGRETRRC